MPGLCWRHLLLSQWRQTLRTIQEPYLNLPLRLSALTEVSLVAGTFSPESQHTCFLKPASFMPTEKKEKPNKWLLKEYLSLWKNHPEM